LAVREGHPPITRLLLESGADVEAATLSKYRPLHMAALNGDLEMVKLLIYHHADIRSMSEISNWPTVLHHGVTAGSEEIVKLLLSQGADRATFVAPDITIQDLLAEKANRQVVYECVCDVVET
jgi:ankyrin repeat protein